MPCWSGTKNVRVRASNPSESCFHMCACSQSTCVPAVTPHVCLLSLHTCACYHSTRVPAALHMCGCGHSTCVPAVTPHVCLRSLHMLACGHSTCVSAVTPHVSIPPSILIVEQCGSNPQSTFVASGKEN